MRIRSTTRWVLAFDSSCCGCTKIAEEVQRHGDDRLDVMPLDHPDVRAWRRRALGDDPPFAPTLIRIHDDQVRAWSGVASGLRLTVG
jgi:hypothetical protein